MNDQVGGKMKKYFGEKITLADCKPRRIYGFYEYLREDGDGEQTVLHYHNLLHTAFEYAIRREILEYNPMDRVERPQVKKFVGDFYSVDEVKELLECAKDDVIYIPIVLAVYCGLRRSEALVLSWSNIDFEKDKIFIGQKLLDVVRNGKTEQIVSDEMKTESSRRSFKMIPVGLFNAKPTKQAVVINNHRQMDAENIMECYITIADECKDDFRAHVEKRLRYFPDAITADKAAEIMGYAKGTIHAYIQQKHIFAVRISGKYIIPKSALVDFLADDFAFEIVHKSLWHMNICLFEIAAKGGNDYAEYQLGKIYLYGKDIPQDYDKAIEYLTASAEHGNRYAEQLLHNIKNNRNWAASMGVFRLFRHMGKILENNIRDDRNDAGGVDRKLRRQINEKKHAQGLKLG